MGVRSVSESYWDVFHTISDFCHTVPLTQPLIIFSLYPWNLISAAPKRRIACQSGHRSRVKIKRDFALILSGHQSVREAGGRAGGREGAFPRKFNTTEWAELHEIQSRLTAAGFVLPLKVPELLWIYKGSPRSVFVLKLWRLLAVIVLLKWHMSCCYTNIKRLREEVMADGGLTKRHSKERVGFF